MGNRNKILKLLMNEIIMKIFNLKNNLFELCEYKNDLNKYTTYFTKSEIEIFNEKIDILKYSITNENKKEWILKNREILNFFLEDLLLFFMKLEYKRKDFIKKIIKECLKAIDSYDDFYKFVSNSENYFINNSHYFEVYEIEKYNQIWFELEIENSVVISYFENTKRIDKWDENQELILIKLQNMLLFLNEIILK